MKDLSVPSTKFLTAIVVAGCLTWIQYSLQTLGQFEYTNTYLGIMAGIVGLQGLLKTVQNVVLNKNGNGNGNGNGLSKIIEKSELNKES
jgi:hypothetical protein